MIKLRASSDDQPGEARLKAYLKSRSALNRDSRPVQEASSIVTVYFGLRLIQVEIDEKANLMRTSVWSRQVGKLLFYCQYLPPVIQMIAYRGPSQYKDVFLPV